MNDDDEQVNAASPGSVRRPRDLVVGWAERCYARLRRPSPAVQARLDTLERVIGELRWRALE